jgi:hypothetical protein
MDMDSTTLRNFTEYTGPWTLKDGNPSGVYFLSIDNATNIEEAGYISQAFLDGTPPSIVIQNPVNDQNINGTSYTITGNSSDNLSGIDSVLLSFDNGATWNAATGTASWSYTWSLPSNDTSIVIIGKLWLIFTC